MLVTTNVWNHENISDLYPQYVQMSLAMLGKRCLQLSDFCFHQVFQLLINEN